MIYAFARFFRALRRGWNDGEFRALALSVVLLLAGGTLFYSRAEGWSAVDSLYFTVVTLTTVGYGDLSPTTTLTRLVTVIFILVGIGLLAAFVTTLAHHGARGWAREDDPGP